MKMFNRRPRRGLDDRLAAEIIRTGIDVEIQYSNYLLRWYAFFPSSRREMVRRTRDQAVTAALRVLEAAPDNATYASESDDGGDQ